MRKNGKPALVIYILLTLFGGIVAIIGYVSLKNIQKGGGGDWDEIGAALVAYFGVILFIIYAITLITKILHLKTGFKFFGINCILIDLAIAGCILYIGLVENGGNHLIIQLMLPLPSLLAFISNLKSIKE